MKFEKKTFVVIMVATIGLGLLLGFASASGAITLTPTSQAPGASVTVGGSGFNASKPVAIGFGAEVAASQTGMPFTGTGPGPYSGFVSYWPVKPGSFVLTSDTTASGGQISTYTDNGDGTLTGSFAGAVGTINYTTGQWSRTSTVDLTGYTQVYSATYIRYEYNVTPAAGVNTTASGTFTAPITVPAVANGNYNVTAIDTLGDHAYATLIVNSAIPEGLTIGVMVLVSTVAVVVSLFYFRKQPKIKNTVK